MTTARRRFALPIGTLAFCGLCRSFQVDAREGRRVDGTVIRFPCCVACAVRLTRKVR